MEQILAMSNNAVSLPPILGDQVHTLILGTVPGQASLKAAQYYAHPRNAFWPIMMAIIDNRTNNGAPLSSKASTSLSYEAMKTLDYAHRCKQLTTQGYAVWDVLASCIRPGSLDSKIVKETETPNNIADMVEAHAELALIVCNGRTAEMLFKRHIINDLSRPVHTAGTDNKKTAANAISLLSLPSTSPAMASLTLTEKYQAWADGLFG